MWWPPVTTGSAVGPSGGHTGNSTALGTSSPNTLPPVSNEPSAPIVFGVSWPRETWHDTSDAPSAGEAQLSSAAQLARADDVREQLASFLHEERVVDELVASLTL